VVAQAYLLGLGQELAQLLEACLRLTVALVVDGTWAVRVPELQEVEAAHQ